MPARSSPGRDRRASSGPAMSAQPLPDGLLEHAVAEPGHGRDEEIPHAEWAGGGRPSHGVLYHN